MEWSFTAIASPPALRSSPRTSSGPTDLPATSRWIVSATCAGEGRKPATGTGQQGSVAVLAESGRRAPANSSVKCSSYLSANWSLLRARVPSRSRTDFRRRGLKPPRRRMILKAT
eukprot:10414340-Heterocapsa_arctica.AAC.1